MQLGFGLIPGNAHGRTVEETLVALDQDISVPFWRGEDIWLTAEAPPNLLKQSHLFRHGKGVELVAREFDRHTADFVVSSLIELERSGLDLAVLTRHRQGWCQKSTIELEQPYSIEEAKLRCELGIFNATPAAPAAPSTGPKSIN